MLHRNVLVLAISCVAACGPNLTHPAGDAGGVAASPGSCLPNLDGRIEAAELRAATGVPANYLLGHMRQVDVAGQVDQAGRRVWDLTAAPDDPTAKIAAGSLGDRWYAAEFPGASFVLPVDDEGTTEAVYSQDDRGLFLHGLASREEAPTQGKTLLRYDAPVAALRFPLEPGRAWKETGNVTAGTLLGLPYVGKDVYDVRVDGSGRVVLPELELTQAMRVRTQVIVMPAVGPARSRRQVSWIFECLGEVARAESRDDEPAEDFTTAQSLRRLAF
jgi:hypothetical protein